MRLYAETRNIEDVARRLGLRSLDRAADLIGLDWTTRGPEAGPSMPDDIFQDALPPAQRTPRKRAFTERDRRTVHERLTDCAHNPDLYDLAEALPPPGRVGRRRATPMLRSCSSSPLAASSPPRAAPPHT